MWPRGEAAKASGMDRQTLCDWVHRYNAGDVAGLATASRPGRPPALSDEQMAELKDIVIQGPDPEKDGVVRWRCIDLRVKIVAHFAVTFSPTQRGQAVAQARPDALAAAAVPSEERRCGAGGS
jgi:transposase